MVPMYRPSATYLFLFGVLIVSSSLAGESLPTFFFPHDSDYILLEYTVVGSAFPLSRTPYLRIYGDGRVHVHRHSHLSRAGEYESHLSYEELDRLLVTLARDGLFEFDRRVVSAEIRAIREMERTSESSTGRLETIMTDTAVSTIRIRLNEYVPSRGGEPRTRVNMTVFWNGLRFDVKKFPEVDALQGLYRTVQRLDKLAKRIEWHEP